MFLIFSKRIDIDVVDDVVCFCVPSSYDDRLELVHQVLDHSVEEEYGMHRQGFCQHLNSKKIKIFFPNRIHRDKLTSSKAK